MDLGMTRREGETWVDTQMRAYWWILQLDKNAGFDLGLETDLDNFVEQQMEEEREEALVEVVLCSSFLMPLEISSLASTFNQMFI